MGEAAGALIATLYVTLFPVTVIIQERLDSETIPLKEGQMTHRIASSTLGVLLVAVLAFPQASGRLEGVVKDPQGLVLPGVTVALKGAAVMGQRVTTTGIDGSYRFPALPPSLDQPQNIA